MDSENPAFTGFFNEGHKRIDFVLVMNNRTGNDMQEELRDNFLINAVKFGLELELEEGKLTEHKRLIFIKVHAPDSIIEDFGLYFNERRFFKDNHIDFVHPYFNLIGIKHERDLIKTIRNQYPGPVNYSTLERSMIVYKILLQLPFGPHENYFGINKLINSNIMLDAFALHDGPYFIPSKQETSEHINARQALFYNWVGVINIWKMQPIHMIKEYLGERVAFYFAYYEYFNIMLSIISALGVWIVFDQHSAKPTYDLMTPYSTYPSGALFNVFLMIYDNCVVVVNSLSRKESLIYVILWKRKESYLLWMWELNEKLIKKLSRPESTYLPPFRVFYKKFKVTGVSLGYQSIFVIILRGFIILLTVAIFSGMLFAVIIISIRACYFKNWYRYRVNKSIIDWKRGEHKYIGISAATYTTIVFLFKIVATILSYILTEFEYYKTYESYERSLAIKIYGFCFSSTFTLLVCYVFIGELIFTHNQDARNYHTLEGYGLLNNGLGTSLDDICVTVAVMVFLDQIIFKIPAILYNKMTDYDKFCVFNTNIPCWEREYKLPNLTEMFIHNSYNAIAMQFALATFFSCTFPVAPLIIFLMNIWDIRYKARKVLLWHRRPLLINTSGPGIWHRVIFVAAHIIPIFNSMVIAYQSRLFRNQYALDFFAKVRPDITLAFGRVVLGSFEMDKEFAEQYKSVRKLDEYKDSLFYYCAAHDYWTDPMDRGKKHHEPSLVWWTLRLYGIEVILTCEAFLLAFTLIIYFLIPSKSDDVQDTIKKEKRIKHKFYVRKGFLGT